MQEPTEEPLPPEPQEIAFTAADGQEHLGTYYPAAVNPADVVVLHHWARGDKDDWIEIAFWLQNRGRVGNTPPGEPWLDPSWFPPMPERISFAIFTFSFRGCDGGCSGFDPDGWLLDAQAAMKTARGLTGVNPQRVSAAGASIGADGAPDGCLWLNEMYPGSCLGALSFSPGSYLTLPYNEVITGLEELAPPVQVWCLYGTGDIDSAEACESASGDHYQTFSWEGNDHGMMLLRPEVDPSALLNFLEFLMYVYEY